MKFEGLTVFKQGRPRIFKLQTGRHLRRSRLKKGYEKLRDMYGRPGYFQMTGRTKRDADPERQLVDVTVKMEEDKQYYVGRIRFAGNDRRATRSSGARST